MIDWTEADIPTTFRVAGYQRRGRVMSGKIIELAPSPTRHYCKGQPGLIRRILGRIGPGSKWRCDQCKTIWIFEIDYRAEWVGWIAIGKGGAE